MYFWKYKELAAALSGNVITASQYRIYLILFIVQVVLSVFSFLAEPLIFSLSVGAFLAITYAVNQRGDGKDYFRRLVCLDWPITLRTLVVYLVIGLLLEMMVGGVFPPPEVGITHPMTQGEMVLNIVTFVYYVALFVQGFRIAAGQKTS